MKITSTYSVRLRNFNRVFDDTVEVYRHAVDYFIELVMANWNTHFGNLSRANDCHSCCRRSERSYEKASDDALQLLPRLHEISELPSPSRHQGCIRAGVVVSNASGSMDIEAGAKGPAARSAEGRQKLSGHVPRQYVHQSRTQQRETQSSHSQYLGLG